VGEQVIKHNTGAATMITSSRAISVDYGRKLTLFTQKLFNLDPVTKDFTLLGAHLAAKRLYGLLITQAVPMYLSQTT
jgi:hypothetical protein